MEDHPLRPRSPAGLELNMKNHQIQGTFAFSHPQNGGKTIWKLLKLGFSLSADFVGAGEDLENALKKLQNDEKYLKAW